MRCAIGGRPRWRPRASAALPSAAGEAAQIRQPGRLAQPLHPRAHPLVRAIRTGHERPAGTARTPSAPLRASLVITFYTYLEPTPERPPGGARGPPEGRTAETLTSPHHCRSARPWCNFAASDCSQSERSGDTGPATGGGRLFKSPVSFEVHAPRRRTHPV